LKKQEPVAQETPRNDQGEKDERRKKKNEDPRPKAIVREKSAIKKTKVHKALKIHTSNDSAEVPKPTEKPASEKEIVVEQDQNINVAEEGVFGPKETPKPQPEPMVEGQDASTEGQQGHVQKDNTNLKQNAPNSEEKNDTLNHSEVEGKEVYFNLFPNSIFFKPLIALTNLSLCFIG
jgi:hypothetical protein